MTRKNLVNPGTVNREVGLLRSMVNLAAEWFDLELKPIKYEMAKAFEKHGKPGRRVVRFGTEADKIRDGKRGAKGKDCD
jgi:hypothetical protein